MTWEGDPGEERGRSRGATSALLPESAQRCVALLDDMSANSESRSRLYSDLVKVLRIEDCASPGEFFAQIEAALAAGLHPVGLFAYEFGAQLQRLECHPVEDSPAQVLLFRRCRRMSCVQVDAWLDNQVANDARAGIANVRRSVTRQEFHRAIEAVQAYIASGDAYQVNYTYRIDLDVYGSPAALYARLRSRQRVPYGALITLPDGAAIVSLSPELFFRHADGRVQAKPMKGTARAGATPTEVREAASMLAADAKNRAENLMIVDLLRNDIGRLAATGSVKVPALFDVDRFGEVLQMTSTVEADLVAGTTLSEVFEAMFPVAPSPAHRSGGACRSSRSSSRGREAYIAARSRASMRPAARTHCPTCACPCRSARSCSSRRCAASGRRCSASAPDSRPTETPRASMTSASSRPAS